MTKIDEYISSVMVRDLIVITNGIKIPGPHPRIHRDTVSISFKVTIDIDDVVDVKTNGPVVQLPFPINTIDNVCNIVMEKVKGLSSIGILRLW